MNHDVARFREPITLRNGTAAVVRAIRADDRDRLQAAFHALDPESIYLRYFSHKQALTQADLDRLCAPDFETRVVLVVTQTGPADSAGEIIIAAAGYVAHDAPDGVRAAEVAFTVEEDVHGQGIASRLLVILTGMARAAAIERFEAEVLSRNTAMLGVFERCGLPLTLQPPEDGVIRLSLWLTVPPTPAGAFR